MLGVSKTVHSDCYMNSRSYFLLAFCKSNF